MDSVFKPPGALSFNGNVAENWNLFKQKFKLFLCATGKTKEKDETRIGMLLTLIGDEGLRVYNTFKYAEGENKELLEVVINKFDKHCAPLKNIVYERFKFSSISQKEGQSFDNFLVELHSAASSCEFLEEESLIRDRIVVGILDKNVQEQMLREPNLTLVRAAEFARSAEASRLQVKAIQGKMVEIVKVETVESKKMYGTNEHQREMNKTKIECKNCSYIHPPRKCPAFGKMCAYCKRPNHFAKRCPNKIKKIESVIDPNNVNEPDNLVRGVSELHLGSIEVEKHQIDGVTIMPRSWYAEIKMNIGPKGKTIRFKLDTGAEISILPARLFKDISMRSELTMKKTKSVLVAFGNNTVMPEGVVDIDCSTMRVQKKRITFVIANIETTPLLGLEACIKLDLIQRIDSCTVVSNNVRETLMETYKDVFEGLGKFKEPHHIELKPDNVPIVHPPRRVPLSLHEKLKVTLDSLTKRRVIQPVSGPTEWVNSLVIVEKTNGDLRLCLDPRDLNVAVKREYYMIPRAEDLLMKLQGKTIFSVIDMKEGFWQIELDEESAELCTFNTPFGRYRFNRLPYGLCSAPEVFQKKNNETFSDIDGCEIYFDDLIVAGSSIEEHDHVLKQVLERARLANVRFNRDKFQFRVPEVKYVGQIVSGQGVRPDPDQVRAVLEMEKPKNKVELLRLLGMAKYLGNYVPHLSELTSSLRHLTKNVEWQWMPEHDKEMESLKNKLVTAPVLAIFDSSQEVTLQVDASQHGLGACLMQNGQPISYASRSLTETEERYAQVEKELLAIVFGVERYHHFTYGRLVHVQSDHKPLESIFRKDISKVTARLQRMLLKLLKYKLDVVYVPGKHMQVADALSRAHLHDPVADDPEFRYVVHAFSRHLPMTEGKRTKFVAATEQDETLTELKRYFFQGWPVEKNQCSPGTRHYWNLKDHISVEEELVFLDDRLIVPVGLRKYVLGQIHEGHLGVVKCKSRAREILYWPGMSSQIQAIVLECPVCQRFSRSNCRETMLSRETPERPWQRIAMDIMQFGSDEYLVVTDYYSRWIEIASLKRKTAEEVITQLKSIYARFGIPEEVVADNMPFGGLEFRQFAADWDFSVSTSSPNYPQSNGLAEKSVSIIKNMLRRAYEEGHDIYVSLMAYRNTPLSDTGVSPAQLMLKRRMRTKLPACEVLLQQKKVDTGVRDKLIQSKSKVKDRYDERARSMTPIEPGENVVVQGSRAWEPGTVIQCHQTPRSYIVRQANGREVRRNRRHLRKTGGNMESESNPALGDPSRTSETVHDTSRTSLGTAQLAQGKELDGAIKTEGPTKRIGREVKRPERYIEEC